MVEPAYDPYLPERRRPLRGLFLLALLAFVLGAAVVTWALTRWEPAKRLIAPPAAAPIAPSTITTVSPLLGQPDTMPAPLSSDPVAITEARVAGVEARISQVDARAVGAAANASRAEGLLVAFAARRAVDRGMALGYLENQLRERFGSTQPRAVAAVLTAAQAPVTLAGLRRDLDELAPELAGGGPEESWADGARRALASLITVRRKEDPPPAPDARLARARAAIVGDQVDVAMAEVARMPARAKAANWLAAARRYVEAHRALDILEAAALTAPQAAPAASSRAASAPPAAAPTLQVIPTPQSPSTQ